MNDVNANAKAIFLQALDYQGLDDLVRFLDQACGPDAGLRARVEELLRAHQEAGNFLGRPDPPDVTCDEAITEGPGTVIGPYKLLEQIGEGGFGAVFMAEQQKPLRRKVALKILKPGMDSRQVIARFEAARRALAIRDHPNMPRGLDAGTVGSRQSAAAVSRQQSAGAVGGPQAAVGREELLAADCPLPLPTAAADCRLPTAGRPYFVMEL